MSTDCIVVGGGVIGCAVALRLRQRGLAVTLVERGEPGNEASSAAAGLLAPQVEAHGPGPLFGLLRRSRALYPALVEELRAGGLEVAYRETGAIALACTEGELAELEVRHRWQSAAGLRIERLDATALRSTEPALGEALGGLCFPDDHQLDNRLLARALAVAAARAQVVRVRGEVRRLLHDGARVTGVSSTAGLLEAQHVVMAAGSWSTLVDGAGLEAGAVRPVRGQMVELACPRPPFEHAIFGDGGYLVPRADGRVLVGSTEEDAGFEKAVTAGALARLLARAARLCPELAAAPVARFWSGLRPATRDQLPLIGPGALAGLHWATGHFRNGVLLAPLTAELLVASVLGTAPAVDLAPFSPARLA